MYSDGHTVTDAPKLPLNLLDALRAYEADRRCRRPWATEFSAAYLKLKHQEWNAYCAQFTAWEHETTLDI